LWIKFIALIRGAINAWLSEYLADPSSPLNDWIVSLRKNK